MGAIRLFLACVVAINHFRLIVLRPAGMDANAIEYAMVGLNAGYAVMYFYVISGFLISFVLEHKYPRSIVGTVEFYKSRVVRIYSLWWCVYLFSVIAFWPEARQISSSGRFLDQITSLALFGSDWRVAFAGYPDEYYGLFPTGLEIGWTLGAEMTFYLLAPFLLRSITASVLVLLFSAAVRASLDNIFGFNQAWTYHFFPSTVMFFMLGHLSRVLTAKLRINPRLGLGLFVIAVIFSLQAVGPRFDNLFFHASLISFALSLPSMFNLTKDNKVLNFLGDVSYPVYLTHPLLMLTIFGDVFPFSWIGPHILSTAQSLSSNTLTITGSAVGLFVVLAICTAALVSFGVERPAVFLMRKVLAGVESCVALCVGLWHVLETRAGRVLANKSIDQDSR